VRVVDHVPKPDFGWSGNESNPGSSNAPYRLYNIGNNQSVELGRFIAVLEEQLDMPAEKEFLPMQPGEVQTTFVDINDMERDFGYKPKTTIEQGLSRFIAWYKKSTMCSSSSCPGKQAMISRYDSVRTWKFRPSFLEYHLNLRNYSN